MKEKEKAGTGKDRFRAEIIYDEDTVRLLDQTITDTYHPLRRVGWILAAAALILYGVSLGIGTPMGLLFLFIGSVFLPVSRKMTSRNGIRILRVMKNKQLRMSYRFTEKGIFSGISGAQESMTAYKDLIGLVRNGDYLFLFEDRNKALMVNPATLVPKDAGGFEKYLSARTGLEWIKPAGIRGLRLSTLKEMFKKSKKDT